jgi:arsenical pump membrane protein
MGTLAALGMSALVLLATLVAATAGSRRVPPVVVALPGAAVLVLAGAVGARQAVGAVRGIAPTVGFLVVVLLLSHLADREGLFAWAAAATARRSGTSARSLLARVVVLSAVVTAVLSLDATVVRSRRSWWRRLHTCGRRRSRTPTPRATWRTRPHCCCPCRT